MNYNEMAAEYEASARKIGEKLEKLKTKKKSCCGTEQKELLRRIRILESMYIDCDFTAKVMRRRGSQDKGGNTYEA